MRHFLHRLFGRFAHGPGAYFGPRYWSLRYWPKGKAKPSPHSFFAKRYFPVLA